MEEGERSRQSLSESRALRKRSSGVVELSLRAFGMLRWTRYRKRFPKPSAVAAVAAFPCS
jgi:hypothetical protein